MVEKPFGGGKHRWPPGHFAVANHTNPLALDQGSDDVAVHRNAPYVFNLATGDGLAVGDQGQGFEQRARITLRALFPQAPNPGRKVFADLQAVAAGHFLEFEGTAAARLAKHLKGLLEHVGLGALALFEQLVQALQGLRLARSQQKSFDQ